jgi:hypothetical protein
MSSRAVARFGDFVRERVVPLVGASAERPFWLADDFLRATALLLMAWAWERLGATDGHGAEARAAFWRWVWPEFEMRLSMMDATLVS